MRRETAAGVAAVEAGLTVAVRRVDADRLIAKGGLDLATGADVGAERAIRAVLSERLPDCVIVGEEEGGAIPPDGRPYWLVDPICGTRNYASRVPLFSTHVALVEDGQVALAVVGDGLSHEVSFAERGAGAYVRAVEGLERLRTRDVPVLAVDMAGTPLYAGSPEALGSLMAAIVRRRRWYVRQLGTSLVFARLAAGDIGGLLLLGAVPSPLHTAAGCLLAEEAGAVVTDLAGRPWDLATAAFIVGATTELHAELLAMSVSSF